MAANFDSTYKAFISLGCLAWTSLQVLFANPMAGFGACFHLLKVFNMSYNVQKALKLRSTLPENSLRC